ATDDDRALLAHDAQLLELPEVVAVVEDRLRARRERQGPAKREPGQPSEDPHGEPAAGEEIAEPREAVDHGRHSGDAGGPRAVEDRLHREVVDDRWRFPAVQAHELDQRTEIARAGQPAAQRAQRQQAESFDADLLAVGHDACRDHYFKTGVTGRPRESDPVETEVPVLRHEEEETRAGRSRRPSGQRRAGHAMPRAPGAPGRTASRGGGPPGRSPGSWPTRPGRD